MLLDGIAAMMELKNPLVKLHICVGSSACRKDEHDSQESSESSDKIHRPCDSWSPYMDRVSIAFNLLGCTVGFALGQSMALMKLI